MHFRVPTYLLLPASWNLVHSHRTGPISLVNMLLQSCGTNPFVKLTRLFIGRSYFLAGH